MNTEAQKQNGGPEGEDGVSSAATEGRRERSTIDFPYSNLEDAEDGAKALFAAGGTIEVTMAQAASAMGQTTTSSAFRVRISSMRLFGLLEVEQGRVRLTEIGRSIATAHSVLEARVKAFARVPLYARMIEIHDGKALPPAAAVEREFVGLGVAKKQAERARQVFERSARHAGFTKAGSDRFVSPIIRSDEPPPESPVEKDAFDSVGGRGTGGGGDDGEMDPVIRALVKKIPRPGSPWGVDEQIMWLRMIAMAFNMAYGGKRQIKIEGEPEKAAT